MTIAALFLPRGRVHSPQPFISDEALRVLECAASLPFTTKSDFARAYADGISECASIGLLTTARPDGSFGRMWCLTAAGLTVLERSYVVA